MLAGLVLPSPSALSSSAPRTPKSLDAYKTQHADKDKPDYQWCVALSVRTCMFLHASLLTCCVLSVLACAHMTMRRRQTYVRVLKLSTCSAPLNKSLHQLLAQTHHDQNISHGIPYSSCVFTPYSTPAGGATWTLLP